MTKPTEAEIEVERCHRALTRIYKYLRVLEPTLTLEQVMLCPIDATKWKNPEWEDRDAYLLTEEGKLAEDLQFGARTARLRERYPEAPAPAMVFSCGPSSKKCLCKCSDGGPCEHVWDGPVVRTENSESGTCSRCGMEGLAHDMWVLP